MAKIEGRPGDVNAINPSDLKPGAYNAPAVFNFSDFKWAKTLTY